MLEGPQRRVVTRLVPFNELRLQQQCFQLRPHHLDIHPGHRLQEPVHLPGVPEGLGVVRSDAIPQVLRLTHVNHMIVFVPHEVDPGQLRDIGQQRAVQHRAASPDTLLRSPAGRARQGFDLIQRALALRASLVCQP